MSTEKKDLTTEQNIEKNLEINADKRAFMKKFGKYAVVSAGMATLMTPTKSSANNYGGGDDSGYCEPRHGGWLGRLFNYFHR